MAVSIDNERNYLLATPEKSLVDTIFDKDISSTTELLEYLEYSLRIEKDSIRKMNAKVLQELARRFRRPIIQALALLNKELK